MLCTVCVIIELAPVATTNQSCAEQTALWTGDGGGSRKWRSCGVDKASRLIAAVVKESFTGVFYFFARVGKVALPPTMPAICSAPSHAAPPGATTPPAPPHLPAPRHASPRHTTSHHATLRLAAHGPGRALIWPSRAIPSLDNCTSLWLLCVFRANSTLL